MIRKNVVGNSEIQNYQDLFVREPVILETKGHDGKKYSLYPLSCWTDNQISMRKVHRERYALSIFNRVTLQWPSCFNLRIVQVTTSEPWKRGERVLSTVQVHLHTKHRGGMFRQFVKNGFINFFFPQKIYKSTKTESCSRLNLISFENQIN